MQTYSKHMADSKPFIVNSKIITFVCTITIVAVIYFLASPRNVNGTVRLSTSKASSVTRTVFSAKLGINHAIATVDENFLSVCLTWRRRDMWKYDATTEKRLIALSKALSPAYVRIGGTPSDFVIFESSSNPYGELTVHVAKEDLDRINEIARNAGWQVLFTLSVLKRLTKGSWDPSNPYEIVKYVAEKRYKFGWELGNESNHLKKFNVTISPNQLADDFRQLRQHLRTSFPEVEQVLVGPDVTQPRGKALKYLERFLMKGHPSIDAITWHHYYVRSQECTLVQFCVPQVLDMLLQEMKDINSVVSKLGVDLPIWLGETSSASGGGAEGISDRFVAGFMWLDKLGLAAKHGYKVVIRQALFYGNYSLVGQDFEPNPDYWLSLLYKRLFGTKVMQINSQTHQHVSPVVRMYAHCTNTKSGLYKQGAVSLMAINLFKNKEVHVKLDQNFKGLDVDEYLFTPDGNITSRNMKLNDKLLEMGADSSFPALEPRRVKPGDQLILPPLTYAFYVVPEAQAPACLENG